MGRDTPMLNRRSAIRQIVAGAGALGLAGPAAAQSSSDPYVSTFRHDDVTDTRAIVWGRIGDGVDTDSDELAFEYGPGGALSNRTTDVSLGTYSTFSAVLQDLSPGTQYSYRAGVETTDGRTDYGDVQTFTTLASPPGPDVQVEPATDVTDTTATLNGRLESLDGAATVDVYFQYEWPQVTRHETEPQTLSEPGDFSASVNGFDGLVSGVEYEYTAFAEGSDGDATSSLTGTFTTDE